MPRLAALSTMFITSRDAETDGTGEHVDEACVRASKRVLIYRAHVDACH